jgi:hypothetical protein
VIIIGSICKRSSKHFEISPGKEGLIMPLIYFEVYCANCGKGLCNRTTVDERNGVKLEIKPCPECLKNAETAGFNKGILLEREVSRDLVNN